MFWVFVESLGELSAAAIAIGIGGLAVGLIPMLWYWRQGSYYYRPAKLDASPRRRRRTTSPTDGAGRDSRVHEGLPTDF